LRVTRESDHGGRVIVKSNYNYAGVPERLLGVPGAPDEFPGQTDYRVYESIAAVPAHLLEDERVIVERFMPEYEDGRYHVRTLDLVGDSHTSLRLASDHHVVTDATYAGDEEVEPPPELFEIRSRLGVDYGKLDYVVHDGELTLLDVNKTTGASTGQAGPELQARRLDRAAGVLSYLG
jgi:hypothetical protein